MGRALWWQPCGGSPGADPQQGACGSPARHHQAGPESLTAAAFNTRRRRRTALLRRPPRRRTVPRRQATHMGHTRSPRGTEDCL